MAVGGSQHNHTRSMADRTLGVAVKFLERCTTVVAVLLRLIARWRSRPVRIGTFRS